jgi:hypothetical protein
MDDPAGWQRFGVGNSVSTFPGVKGFKVTNTAGEAGTWASIAWFFRTPLDVSIQPLASHFGIGS